MNVRRLTEIAALEEGVPLSPERVLEAALADPFTFGEDELEDVSVDELVQAVHHILKSDAFEDARERAAALGEGSERRAALVKELRALRVPLRRMLAGGKE